MPDPYRTRAEMDPPYEPTDAAPPAQPYPPQAVPVQTPPGQYQPQAAAPQVVYVQPPAAPAAPAPAATAQPVPALEEPYHPAVTVISHSNFFYWWPVWVVGFIMFLLTWSSGQSFTMGENEVRLYPNNNLGVLFFTTIILVILITNLEVRGLASLVVIMAVLLAVVLLAYFRLWDDVLNWVGGLNVFLNQGAYFWFSTVLFITWLLATFVFDRMTYWVFKPGQVTKEYVWGAASESYDTENMTMEKRRDDLFRHWILGLGSGDLRIHTHGPRAQEMHIPNVLFVGYKLHAIQHMMAAQPATTSHGASA